MQLNKIYWTISPSSEDTSYFDYRLREPYQVKHTSVEKRYNGLYYEFACFSVETGEPDFDTNASFCLSESDLERFIFETEKAALSAFITAKGGELEEMKSAIPLTEAYILRLKERLVNS